MIGREIFKFRTRIPSPKFFSTNKLFAIIFFGVLLIGVVYFIGALGTGLNKSSLTSNVKNDLAPPKATQEINKDFQFPLKDQKGEEISKLNFVVENAEVRDQIVVKGQRASAISGRDFLVLNLKITNDFKKTVQINTRDYLRLSVNNNEKELLAPEIHNDPVEVQATSTKYTRVAFAIDESAKSLKLRVGEIDKDKTVIDLTVK